MTSEKACRQVYVEMHPVYRECLLFQCVDPYFVYNHKDFSWFSDDGILFDNYLAPNIITGLRAEGYEVWLSDEVEAFLADLFTGEYHQSSYLLPTTKLKMFQQFGVRYLLKNPKGFFVWDTGCGKCIGSISIAAERLERDEVDHVVVWVPNHLIRGWLDDFAKFSSLSVERMDRGTPAKREKAYKESQAQVWVVNYDKVRCNDYDFILSALKGKRVMFVFDEITKLKNRKSAVHKFMVKLSKDLHVGYMLGLSATPVERGPEDYYNIFRVLDPHIYGNVKDFEENYTYQWGAKDFFYNYVGFQNLHDMRFKSTFMVSTARKTQPEIACEFPEKQEIAIKLELSPEDAKLYKFVRDKAMSELKEDTMASPAQWADAARRVCSLPETLLLMNGKEDFVESVREMDGVADSKRSAKLAATLDLVRGIIEQGDKVIVFYSLTNHGIIPLAEHFKEFDPLLFHGGMTSQEKENAVDIFRQTSDHNLMFVSEAGREGLNLPEAGYVIHYNTPYLWSHYEQRSNRIHRIDSKRENVTIYRFITADTIEERIEEVMFQRKAYADDLGVADDSVPTLGRFDERYLLFGDEG